jgi:hypothetical protein
MRPALACLLACAACAGTAHPAPSGAVLPPLLAGFRDATGGAAWDRARVLETRGTIEVGGLHGTIETLEDVASGRHREALHLGAIEQADGFDGTASWTQEPGGEVSSPDAPEAVARARTDAWLVRRGYFHPGGAAYRDLGEQRDGGVHLRGLEAIPDGGAAIELWFDDAGLLARTRQRQNREIVVTTFGDWRDAGDVRVPFHVVIDRGDPRNRVTVIATEVRRLDATDDAAFARPAQDADRVSFTGGVTSSEVPFELINNHIYVRATVDGAPVRMLLDTGGANVLTPAAVKRLGLTAAGAMAASGVGADKVDVGFAHAKALAVGDVVLAKPVFYVVDFARLHDIEGVDFDGLVGFEMFQRLAVRIDYPGQRLTMTAPAAFTAPAGAIAVPFELGESIPIVHGTIDGIAGRFWIDTGSRVSLTTFAKFTRDHDLIAKYHPRFEQVTGWGVGGPVRSHPVRFHEVTLGGAVVHDVVGDLFTGDKGAMSDPDGAANLGGGILHRFVVTFDYAHRTMFLEPKTPDEREHYDRSGLFLMRDGDAALRVIAVIPGSPAEQAGVAADDRITQLDGAAIPTRTLAAWRASLRDREPGTKVKLRVERDGAKPREVTITLAELVP